MIGLIGAMALEVENLVKELDSHTEETILGITFHTGKLEGKDVVLAVCGVGKVFAAICAQTMILRYHPECILNIGVAGALAPELQVGDMAIATAAIQHDMDTSAIGDPVGLISGINLVQLPCDLALAEKIALCSEAAGYRTVRGIVASGDQFIADPSKKAWIRTTFDAIACEMEGAAIVHTCYAAGVQCGVIRSISDSLEGDGMDFEAFKHLAAAHSNAVVKMLVKGM